MTAEALQKVLEAATGPDGENHLRTAYGTNTLSAALLGGDQDVRVLHAMDFRPGTFASTNLLKSLRHPSDQADVQRVDHVFSEKEGVAGGLVSLERTNTYRAICLYDALNLMCEVHPLRYELTEHGVYLSFDPGRERNPEPEPDPETEATWKALGFGAENSFPVPPGP